MGQSVSTSVLDLELRNTNASSSRPSTSEYYKEPPSKRQIRSGGPVSNARVHSRSPKQPVDRRSTNLANTRLRAKGVSSSEQRPPKHGKKLRILSNDDKSPRSCTSSPRTNPRRKVPQSMDNYNIPPRTLDHAQTLALNTIRFITRILDRYSFPLSRAAKAAGHKEQTPDLSILTPSDLRSLKTQFNLLVDTLREIHDGILEDDPGLSKEVLAACGDAILRRADVDFARRSPKSSTHSRSRANSIALIAILRSSLLCTKATVRRTRSYHLRSKGSKGKATLPLNGALTPELLSVKLEPSDELGDVETDHGSEKSIIIAEDQPLFNLPQSNEVPPLPDPILATLTAPIRLIPIEETVDHVSRRRPTLEERFASLRKATAEATLPVNAEPTTGMMESSPTEMIDIVLQTSESDGDTLASSRESSLSVDDKDVEAKHIARVIKTVNHNDGSYIKELSKSEYSDIDLITSHHDLLEFSVLGSQYRPLSQYSWTSKISPGFIQTERVQRPLIRHHISEKLNAELRSFALFYSDKPGTTSKISVKIILDPYITLIVGSHIHILDFSNKFFNKACLTVGALRRYAAAKIGERRQHKIHLTCGWKALEKDSVLLKDTGFLSDKICQGWDPLFIEATIEIVEKDCIVCGDSLHMNRFPKHITSTCNHSINTCRNCLRTWIKTALKSNGWDKITCTECTSLLQHHDIKINASPRQFEKYDTLSTRAALAAIPNFHWCLSPTCPSGQEHEAHADGPIFACHGCGYRYCTQHSIPWHEGETCQQFDYRVSSKKKRDEEQASEDTIRNTTKPCPRCEAAIEKNNGCDHMTCWGCRHEFCWVCLGEYEPIRRLGNRMHRSTCTHYRL